MVTLWVRWPGSSMVTSTCSAAHHRHWWTVWERPLRDVPRITFIGEPQHSRVLTSFAIHQVCAVGAIRYMAPQDRFDGAEVTKPFGGRRSRRDRNCACAWRNT